MWKKKRAADAAEKEKLLPCIRVQRKKKVLSAGIEENGENSLGTSVAGKKRKGKITFRVEGRKEKMGMLAYRMHCKGKEKKPGRLSWVVTGLKGRESAEAHGRKKKNRRCPLGRKREAAPLSPVGKEESDGFSEGEGTTS